MYGCVRPSSGIVAWQQNQFEQVLAANRIGSRIAVGVGRMRLASSALAYGSVPLAMAHIAIDTCSADASFAVQRSGGVAADVFSYPRGAKVADVLFGDLQAALASAGAGAPGFALQSIVATTGPGSFTGQRLGLAIAQGLAATHPAAALYGLTTLHAAAIGNLDQSGGLECLVVADARRGQFYVQAFGASGIPVDACALADAAEIADRLAASPRRILALDEVALGAAFCHGACASGVGPLARGLLAGNTPERFGIRRVDRLRPLYLKPPDAAPSRSAGLRAS